MCSFTIDSTISRSSAIFLELPRGVFVRPMANGRRLQREARPTLGTRARVRSATPRARLVAGAAGHASMADRDGGAGGLPLVARLQRFLHGARLLAFSR